MRRLLVLALGLSLGSGVAAAQPAGASRGESMAWSAVSDIVRVQTSAADGSAGEEGFGFVFGVADGTLYVATADHVVRGGGDDPGAPAKIQVTFANDQGHRYSAELLDLRLPPARGDLAVLELPRPETYVPDWPPYADADSLQQGARAWRIGKLGRWVPGSVPGGFVGRSSGTWLAFDNLDTPRGSSGGPIVTEDGIIGMVVADGGASGAPSNVLPIGTIRGVLLGWQLPWNLPAAGSMVRLRARTSATVPIAPGFLMTETPPPRAAAAAPAAPAPTPTQTPLQTALATPLAIPAPVFAPAPFPAPFPAPSPAPSPAPFPAPSPAPSSDYAAVDSELALNMTFDDRVAIQRGLAALGYAAGVADGDFGQQTRDAIRAYQARAGLGVTGYLTADLQSRIRMDAARAGSGGPAWPAAMPAAPAMPQGGMAGSVRDFVMRYYADASRPNGLEYLGTDLGERVLFYGQSMSRTQVLAQQAAAFRRWPVHTYTVRPDSVSIACDVSSASTASGGGGRICRAQGVMDYEMQSAERNATSTGSERFVMDVDASLRPPVLVGMQSTGLQRTMSAPTPAPASVAATGAVVGERWTARSPAECGFRFYTWVIRGDLFEFTDEQGQSDVERVLQRGPGMVTTETVASTRRTGAATPTGTRWSYVYDPNGSVRVHNMNTGAGFTLRSCGR